MTPEVAAGRRTDTVVTGEGAQYVGFALDGQLVNTYPETAGLAWTIRVDDQVGGRDDRSSRVLTQLADAVRRNGGDLVVA